MKNLTLNEMITLMSTHIENQKEINLQGALYTEENVLHMLKSIVQPPAIKLPPNWASECAYRLVDFMENDFTEYVDFDDVEFELYGRELSVSSVGMDSRSARRNLESFFDTEIELMEEAFNEELPEVSGEVSQEHEEFNSEVNNDENCIS